VTGGQYEVIGRGYAAGRRTDPRIAARIWAALGSARTVVNIGAGEFAHLSQGVPALPDRAAAIGRWTERNREITSLTEIDLCARLLIA
jgi:hypothetical protein